MSIPDGYGAQGGRGMGAPGSYNSGYGDYSQGGGYGQDYGSPRGQGRGGYEVE